MKIGPISISPVVDGTILSKLSATKPFPEPGSLVWQDQHGMFHPDGLIESTLGGFLIRTPDRVALVDAGAGQPFPNGYAPPAIAFDDPDDPIASILRHRGLQDEQIRQAADVLRGTHVIQGQLPASLDALGVRPDEVTDVIFTHLHFDHIGWASAEGAAFFPNATIRCASADLEHFLAGPDEEQFTSLIYRALSARERLAPVLDRIETWEADGTLAPVATGIRVPRTHGTPPMIRWSTEIRSKVTPTS